MPVPLREKPHSPTDLLLTGGRATQPYLLILLSFPVCILPFSPTTSNMCIGDEGEDDLMNCSREKLM